MKESQNKSSTLMLNLSEPPTNLFADTSATNDGNLIVSREEIHDTETAVQIFTQALSGALAFSQTAAGEEFRIGGISVPDHFNDTSTSAIRKALGAVHPDIEIALRGRPSSYSALQTYAQDGCTNRYGGVDYADDTEDDDWVLLVEKSFGRGRAIPAEIMPWGPAIDKEDMVVAIDSRDLLERAIPDSKSDIGCRKDIILLNADSLNPERLTVLLVVEMR